ncbi:MAG: S-layer homology domain-containing protein [Ruminococcaceae bacterium]|nr:S-layer homology domain-containing protein [Oscillospiraceae bacterium]
MKKLILTLLIAFCILCPASVFADMAVDTAVISGSTLTVTGTIPDDASQWVTLEILKDNVVWTSSEKTDTLTKSLDEFRLESDDIGDYLEYFTQIGKGPYTLTVKGVTLSNDPEIRIRLGKDKYFFYSPRAVASINSAVAAGNAEAVKNAILGNTFLTEEIADGLALISEDEEEQFWQDYVAIGDFSSLSAIANTFEEYVILFKITNSSASNFAENLALAKDYGIDSTNSYDLFMGQGDFDNGELGEEQKSALVEMLLTKKSSYATLKNFVEAFEENTVLFAVHNSNSKHLISSVLSKSDVISKNNIKAFTSLGTTAKLEVCTLINKTLYQSISALEAAVDSASKSVASSQQSSKPQGGSGGKIIGSASSVPITPSIETIPSAFKDLDSHLWAKDAIEYLKSKKIVQGKSEEYFAPSDNVTRAEFTKIIVLALSKYNAAAKADFDDVSTNDWEYLYVASAKEANLINGISDKTFGSSLFLTREDMAVIIARALSYDNKAVMSTQYFDDAEISAYAKAAVNYVKTRGIMTGMGDGNFSPKTNVTRAEACKAIYELIKKG